MEILVIVTKILLSYPKLIDICIWAYKKKS